MTLSEDTILENRYRIDSLLADTAGGATYRGFDLTLKTPVVIKEKVLENAAAINHFKQEALHLSGLRHPALPLVMQNFSVADKQYLVMDYISGASLGEFIVQNGRPLPEDHALQSMIRVTHAVQYLHQQKPPIIHRDIKPHNIKFSPQGEALLLDFGVAKNASAASDLAAYLSPEQRAGQSLSPAADLYSLGATLYTLVTGERPPEKPNAPGFEPASAHSALNPKIAAAIAHALRLNPSERPASAAIWQKELEAALLTAQSFSPRAAAQPVPAPAGTGPAKMEPAQKTGSKRFWLVNPAGVGFAIESDPFIIGSGPEANIRLDDPSVAASHVRVRVERERCSIKDEQSELGTYLNEQRLGSVWYPLEPGDILVIGNTRFYLTSSKPAKTSPSKPVPVASPRVPEAATGASVETPAMAATPVAPTRKPALIVGVALLLIGLIAGSIFLVRSFSQTTPAATATVSSAPETGSLTTPPTEPTAPPPASPTAPPVATTATEEVVAAALEDAPTDAPTATRPATASPTTAPVQETVVITAAETVSPSLTLTPTTTATAPLSRPLTVTPTPNGPTPIPVQAEETISQIGAREVIDVDLNPANPQEVYALVKREGIYKSNTGGSGPWLKLPLDASGVTALALDPTNPARLYAPTWNAVLKSTDGGNSWQANTDGLNSNRTVDVVTIDPVEPSKLYAGVGETLVVSTDGGQRWQPAGTGLGVSKIHSIVVDPFNHSTVYVGGLAGSVYKSEDGGATFIQLPSNIGQGAFGMAAHPNQPNVYLVGINSGDAGIVKTENGFEFETASQGLIYGGADSAYSAIAYAPSNPNIVYAGSGYENNLLAKGIFKSSNGGETWVQISSTLALNPDTRQPYYVKAIAVDPTDANTVFAATGGGLYQSSDGGVNWQLR